MSPSGTCLQPVLRTCPSYTRGFGARAARCKRVFCLGASTKQGRTGINNAFTTLQHTL